MTVSVPNLPTQPGFIHLSNEERESGKWHRSTMQRAMELLHRDGLLCMTGLADHAHLEHLRDEMLKDAREIQATKTKLEDFNHGIATNHLQSPPLTNPAILAYEDIWSNQFVHQICEAYLGPDIQQSFITANNAMANKTQRQNVHKDTPFLHPLAPYMLNTNILLSDFTPENGSTEFWLGSHVQAHAGEQLWAAGAPRPTCDVAPAVVANRTSSRPGAQISAPFGTYMLRDMRTWHGGMPNTTDTDRIMVAISYAAAWYPRSPADEAYKAPESARAVLTKRTACCATFVPDEEWERVCQNWRLGARKEESIYLPGIPGVGGTGAGAPGDKPTGAEWETLNVCPEADRIINPTPNLAATRFGKFEE